MAVAKKVGTGNWTIYNIFRDHLGTITHLKDATTGIVTEYSFDAWGRRRDANDWTTTLTNEPALFADRGFTGHEYLEDFKLYNMNGRLYDPVVGRFLSPDPYIQDPANTQSYNRYSYCLNNPLKYTDPSGNTWWDKFWDWTAKYGIQFGVNMGPRGFTPNVSAPGPGNTRMSVGYNMQSGRVGFGNNSSGFMQFYFPQMNFNYPGQISEKAVSQAKKTDKNGNGTFFNDQTSAYKYMWKNALKDKTEYGGIISTEGVIVSRLDEDGGEMWFGNTYSYDKKTHQYSVTYNNKSYDVIAHIHVHWHPNTNYWSFVGDPDNDFRTIRLNPNLDFYLMTPNGSLYYRMYDGTNWYEDKSTVDMLLNGYKLRK